MTLTKRGFTLVELLVVVAMIAIIMGAMSVSVSGAMERARIQRATAEVKIITQAILAYENETKNGADHKLPPLNKADCDASTLGFLLGGESGQSGRIPVLLQASLSGNGKILDPWGHPYKVTIKETHPKMKNRTTNLQTGFCLPNANRLGEGER